MLLMSLTCLRAEVAGPACIEAALQGSMREAIRMASRENQGLSPMHKALLGQVVARAWLAMGDEEQGDDLLRKQLRMYEAISRPAVRWLSGLDHGVLFLQLNHMARAAQSFAVPADDVSAPPLLRVEALAGLARALHGMGENERAQRLLQHAVMLAGGLPPRVAQVLDAMRVELRVLASVPVSRALHGVRSVTRDVVDRAQLLESAQDSALSLRDIPLAAERMRFVRALLRPGACLAASAGDILGSLAWLKARRLSGYDAVAKIEAAQVFMRHEDHHHAAELTGLLTVPEDQVHRHRHALELLLCLSHLHAVRGRHADALRLYRDHAEMGMIRLRRDLARLPYMHNLDREITADSLDAAQLRLPPKYRKAYAFMLDNLSDQSLSIKRVASHVDVTERALQMAFRTYLGMTPAELIRHRRKERIEAALQAGTAGVRATEVAARWGMGVHRPLEA